MWYNARHREQKKTISGGVMKGKQSDKLDRQKPRSPSVRIFGFRARPKTAEGIIRLAEERDESYTEVIQAALDAYLSSLASENEVVVGEF